MVSKSDRLNRWRRTGLLVGACILLKPVLLLGHLLLEDHCWHAEIVGDCRAALEGLARVGFAHRQHEHEVLAQYHCPPAGVESPHSHCPHPVEEHYETLRGDPSDVRLSSAVLRPPQPHLVASAMASPSSGGSPVGRRLHDRPESAPCWRVRDSQSRPRAPPSA